MEDADKGLWTTETLNDQYQTVKAETTKSHVLQWGDVSFTNELAAEFETGAPEALQTPTMWQQMKHIGKQGLRQVSGWDKFEAKRKNDFAVDSRDIQLHYRYARVMENPSKENHQALLEEIAMRMKIDKIFEEAYPQHM